MRVLVFALFAAAAPAGLVACASLKTADLPADGVDGASGSDGATSETGREPPGADAGDARSKDADPASKAGDPRWPLWPLPADAPGSASYTFANGPDGAMLTDAVTGLVWQDTVPTTARDQAAAKAYCDALVYDGLSDWRLPLRIEATSIMSFKPDFGGTEMAAPAFSAVAGAQCFWTASTFVQYAGTGWSVNPAGVAFMDAASKCAARCVRGAPAVGAPIAKQYDLIDASALRDPVTGLVWERNPPVTKGPWAAADARCKALTLAGHVMRLPGVKELASIIDETKHAPASSGVLGDYAARMFTSNVRWTVDFDQGNAFQGPDGFDEWSRCVSGP